MVTRECEGQDHARGSKRTELRSEAGDEDGRVRLDARACLDDGLDAVPHAGARVRVRGKQHLNFLLREAWEGEGTQGGGAGRGKSERG